MRSIYVYKKFSGEMSVSAIKQVIERAGGFITVHHTLKYGNAQTFWYSIFHYTTGFVDFDVRELWESLSIPRIDDRSWMEISFKARLDHVTNLLENMDKTGMATVDQIISLRNSIIDKEITEKTCAD